MITRSNNEMSDEVIKITNKNSRRMPTLAAYPSSHIAECWLDTAIVPVVC